jgi:hypothetical protein
VLRSTRYRVVVEDRIVQRSLDGMNWFVIPMLLLGLLF